MVSLELWQLIRIVLQRYFLAEILKTSEVPLADLVKTIQDRNVVPQWEQMALPNGELESGRSTVWATSVLLESCGQALMFHGLTLRAGRSLASCRHQFSLLTNRVSSVLVHPSAAQPSAAPPPAPYGRPVQARHGLMQPPLVTSEPIYTHHQYQFAPINDPGHPAGFQTAPYNPTETMDKAGKKRGRPSKQERELREAEARSRGETYQPTKRKKAKERSSIEAGEIGTPTEAGSAKKKARRPSTELEPAGPSPRSFPGPTPNIQTSPTDRMQVDPPERRDEEAVLRAEAARPSAFRGLLATGEDQGLRFGGRPLISSMPSAPAPVGEAESSAAPSSQVAKTASPTESGPVERASTSGGDTREASETKAT